MASSCIMCLTKPHSIVTEGCKTKWLRSMWGFYWISQKPYLLEWKTRFCSYIWHSNMWGHLKFVHEVPNWITLNWTMQNQTKACITNRHARSLLFWGIIQHWVVIPYWRFGTTYWSPFLRVKKSREKRAWLKLTDSLPFWDTSKI
jgi:hypothetical protein